MTGLLLLLLLLLEVATLLLEDCGGGAAGGPAACSGVQTPEGPRASAWGIEMSKATSYCDCKHCIKPPHEQSMSVRWRAIVSILSKKEGAANRYIVFRRRFKDRRQSLTI